MNILDSRETTQEGDAAANIPPSRPAAAVSWVAAVFAYALAASTLVMLFVLAAWREAAASAFRYVGF